MHFILNKPGLLASLALSGILSSPRDKLASLWITDGGRNVDLIATLGLPDLSGLIFGVIMACLALSLTIYMGHMERRLARAL